MSNSDAIILDLGKWTVQDFDDFLTFTAENRLADAAKKLSVIIVSWPYAGDPTNPEAVCALKLADYKRLLKQVNVAMQTLFSEGE